jgi:HlyD family type I secretion membrane fusion protein
MKDYFKKVDHYWNYRPVLWMAVLCFLTFILWSSFTNLDEHVRGTGRIIPAGDMRVIQHLEGGIVQDILINEGERVTVGDILFYIDNQKAEADLEELQIQLMANQIKLQRLQAELSEQDTLEFDPDIESAYAQIVITEKQIFAARRAELSEIMEGLKKRMKQKVLRLDELNSNIENLDKELGVAREQLGIKDQLRKSGAISRSQYLDTLSQVRNFETRIDQTKKEIPIVKTELAEITNQLEEGRQNWMSETGERVNDVQVEIKKVTERIRAFEDQVNRTAVRSPVNGLVNKVYVNTIGGVIQPGSPLAEVLPIEDNLIVEGRISTNDRGKIWPGLPVVTKITAYDYTLYGGLEGEVFFISPNSFLDEQGNEYYQIRVKIDSTKIGDDLPVYPGMTADINIVAGQVSVLHALLKPFQQIRQNALREK